MFALLFVLQNPVLAGDLAGVSLPDTVTVGGQSLVLNGMGLREKLFFDIYVGGLYLPAKTTDWRAAVAEEGPKRIVMHFLYKEVTAEQIVETFSEGLAHDPNGASQAADFQKLYGWMETVHPGDEVVLEWAPGAGTTVTVKGQVKGTIAGAAFMKALWGIYIGEHPPTAPLKSGMMGG